MLLVISLFLDALNLVELDTYSNCEVLFLIFPILFSTL
jgi:hypothetical protein